MEKFKYKGEIKNFPEEVVTLMLERQKEQTGVKDLNVFYENPTTGAGSGGFGWDDTPEGHHFWKEVIVNENFKVFFEKYPKEHPKKIFRKWDTVKIKELKSDKTSFPEIWFVKPEDPRQAFQIATWLDSQEVMKESRGSVKYSDALNVLMEEGFTKNYGYGQKPNVREVSFEQWDEHVHDKLALQIKETKFKEVTHSDFKKGDKVEIINSGKTYSGYKELFAFLKWNKDKYDAHIGQEGTIIKLINHPHYDDTLACVEGPANNFVVGVGGIKKIESKPSKTGTSIDSWWIKVTKENQKVLSEWRADGAGELFFYIKVGGVCGICNAQDLFAGEKAHNHTFSHDFADYEIDLETFYEKTGMKKQEIPCENPINDVEDDVNINKSSLNIWKPLKVKIKLK